MKRYFFIVLTVLIFNFRTCFADGLVHDPITLKVQSVEASNTISELITLLETVDKNGGFTEKLLNFQEKIMGEGTVFGQTIEEIKYLKQMTESFNNIIDVCTLYINLIEEGNFPPDTARTMLRQIRLMTKNAMDMIDHYKELFKKENTTKEEKEDEVQQTKDTLMKLSATMYNEVENQLKSLQAAEEMKGFESKIAQMTSAEAYVAYRQSSGSVYESKRSIITIVKFLLGLLGVISLIWAWISMVRGSAAGDNTSQMGFLRVGVGMLGSAILLTVIETVLNYSGVL